MGNTPIQTTNDTPKVQVAITHLHENPPPRGWKKHETLYFYTYSDVTIEDWLLQFNKHRRPEYQLAALKRRNGLPHSKHTTMDKGPFYV